MLFHDDDERNTGGVKVPIDITALLDEVYVAPLTPDWVQHVTQRELDVHGIPQTVRRSPLLDLL